MLRVRNFVGNGLNTPLILFDRLYLSNHQLTTLPDCIGQLTSLTLYGIRFVICMQLILILL